MYYKTIVPILLVATVAIGALFYFKAPPPSAGVVSNTEDQAVRAFVTEFGNKFKNVSLLADDVSAQIANEYSAYASPELIGRWQSGQEFPPGRHTSSPWPDRIEIVEVKLENSGIYRVLGNVIEITNADTPLEPAAVYPIFLTIEKRGNGFIVTHLEKGAYSQIPQRQTVVGYWECLPLKPGIGETTGECALGIAIDQSDGHLGVNTSLMAQYPVDFPTGTKVRVEGIVVPATQLSTDMWQKYDMDGIINATTIIRVE